MAAQLPPPPPPPAVKFDPDSIPAAKGSQETDGKKQEEEEEEQPVCPTFICGVCRVKMTSPIQAQQHFVSKAHDKAVKEKEAGRNPHKAMVAQIPQGGSNSRGRGRGYGQAGNTTLGRGQTNSVRGRGSGPAPGPYHDQNRKRPSSGNVMPSPASNPSPAKRSHTGGESFPPKCNLCMVLFNSKHSADQHFKGKRHLAAVAAKGTESDEVATLAVGDALGFTCHACNITLNSDWQLNQHNNGIRHKLKAGIIKEPPSWWLDQQEQLSGLKPGSGKGVGQMFECSTCHVKLNSQQQLGQHLVSNKHREMEKRASAPARGHFRGGNRGNSGNRGGRGTALSSGRGGRGTSKSLGRGGSGMSQSQGRGGFGSAPRARGGVSNSPRGRGSFGGSGFQGVSRPADRFSMGRGYKRGGRGSSSGGSMLAAGGYQSGKFSHGGRGSGSNFGKRQMDDEDPNNIPVPGIRTYNSVQQNKRKRNNSSSFTDKNSDWFYSDSDYSSQPGYQSAASSRNGSSFNADYSDQTQYMDSYKEPATFNNRYGGPSSYGDTYGSSSYGAYQDSYGDTNDSSNQRDDYQSYSENFFEDPVLPDKDPSAVSMDYGTGKMHGQGLIHQDSTYDNFYY